MTEALARLLRVPAVFVTIEEYLRMAEPLTPIDPCGQVSCVLCDAPWQTPHTEDDGGETWRFKHATDCPWRLKLEAKP